jgi:hypothetical protein
MVCDLERVFDSLACRVPTDASGNDSLTFFSATLPIPPTILMTDRLIIGKRRHQYNSYYRADSLVWQAQKPTYRHLGLLILSVVFHEAVDRVQVDLLHPESDIKHLVVEYPYPRELPVGYSTRPYAFEYFPCAAEKHPWYHTTLAEPKHDLPCFFLTNLDDTVVSDEQWEKRDTVRGFGSDEANVRFAELLVNASRPDSEVDEYELEGEGGFRGVGPQSAEVMLFLPGSPGWSGAV